jgi:lipopolysaccharide export system protein LptA
MRTRFEWTAFVLLAVVVVGTEARAQGGTPPDLFESLSLTSRKEPIQIKSDSLELDYKDSTLTYRGNVQVTQGDVTLASDRLSITYDRATGDDPPGRGSGGTGGVADSVKQIVAEGHVRIRQNQRVAEGRRAVFDQAKQTIVLSDGAVLHEGPNQVAGDRIVVYLREQRSVVEGGSNSRVQAVLYPRAESSPEASAATPAGGAAAATPAAASAGAGGGSDR